PEPRRAEEFPGGRYRGDSLFDAERGHHPLRRRARGWRDHAQDYSQGGMTPRRFVAVARRAGLLAGALALGLGGTATRRIERQKAAPDTAGLLRAVRVLAADSMEGRLAGSPGSARARRYLLTRLRALKLEPLQGSFEHPFSLPGAAGTGVNLLARLRGT